MPNLSLQVFGQIWVCKRKCPCGMSVECMIHLRWRFLVLVLTNNGDPQRSWKQQRSWEQKFIVVIEHQLISDAVLQACHVWVSWSQSPENREMHKMKCKGVTLSYSPEGRSRLHSGLWNTKESPISPLRSGSLKKSWILTSHVIAKLSLHLSDVKQHWMVLVDWH